MLYSTRGAVFKKFRAGDDAWAFEFRLQANKTRPYLFAAPFRGRFAEFPSAVPPPGRAVTGAPLYFVPYNKTGKLAWSRAVTWSARIYADTKAEAAAGFDAALSSAAGWMRRKADELDAKRVGKTAPAPTRRPVGTYGGFPAYDADDFAVFSAYVIPRLDLSPDPESGVPAGTLVRYDVLDGKSSVVSNAVRLSAPNAYGNDPAVVFVINDGNPRVAFVVHEAALLQIPGFEFAYEQGPL